MTAEEIYLAWAPPDAIWSRWVKPVLFAHMELSPSPAQVLAMENRLDDVSHIPPASAGNAIVIDLPGGDSIRMGLSLMRLGYRPVPVFNALPAPGGTDPSRVVIDMSAVVSLLKTSAQDVIKYGLAENAPPAFLLDSRRRGGGIIISPRWFDNRSVSLPTDFPSGNFLLANGIRSVLVVQSDSASPQADLGHTLRRWQETGLPISLFATTAPSNSVSITNSRPPWFRHMWYGMLARMGLRRNPLGGFGGFIPEPSAG